MDEKMLRIKIKRNESTNEKLNSFNPIQQNAKLEEECRLDNINTKYFNNSLNCSIINKNYTDNKEKGNKINTNKNYQAKSNNNLNNNFNNIAKNDFLASKEINNFLVKNNPKKFKEKYILSGISKINHKEKGNENIFKTNREHLNEKKEIFIKYPYKNTKEKTNEIDYYNFCNNNYKFLKSLVKTDTDEKISNLIEKLTVNYTNKTENEFNYELNDLNDLLSLTEAKLSNKKI